MKFVWMLLAAANTAGAVLNIDTFIRKGYWSCFAVAVLSLVTAMYMLKDDK